MRHKVALPELASLSIIAVTFFILGMFFASLLFPVSASSYSTYLNCNDASGCALTYQTNDYLALTSSGIILYTNINANTKNITNIDYLEASSLGGTFTIPLSRLEQGGAATNQLLAWSGSAWNPTSLSAGTGISITGLTISVSNIPLSELAQETATTNQVLAWNGTSWAPASLSAGTGITVSGLTISIDTSSSLTWTSLQTFDDAIKVGYVNINQTGIIRWSGSDFQGYNGTEWLSLTAGTGGGGLSGSGSANLIAFWTGSSTLSSDSALFWNASANRLGILTSNPSSELHVNGTITANIIDTDSLIGSYTIPLSKLEQGGALTDQVLAWNGTAWSPSSLSAGTGISVSGLTISIDTSASLTWSGLHYFSGGIRVDNEATLGTCDATRRGELVLQAGGTGVADKLYVCMKKSDDTYAWVLVAVP